VRETFPQSVWSRTIALMSISWSVSVMIGPLVGGLFAEFGSWRAAFVATAVAACGLAVGAFFILRKGARGAPDSRVPAGRVALICLAIAATSLASVVASPMSRAGLLVAALVSLAAMLRLNRFASAPLLPRDAFLWRIQTGVGLWLALLLCITYSPLQIYMPMFLQQLHGFTPLAAGLAVAAASLAWTLASLMTAGVSPPLIDRLMLTGPAVMGLSLAMIALFTPRSSTLLLIPAIALLGAGIGQCWPFVVHRIMDGAAAGDETVAASSVPTVQQMGFAFGGAIAGLIADASGLASATAGEGMLRAASWVPASFVASAILAVVMGLRLRHLRKS
jgi:predicted MFS family arabinose efflux permease